MDIGVEEETYFPRRSENILFRALRDTKISFVFLLFIVIAIYIGIFFLLDTNNDSEQNTSSMQKFIIICLEVVLWSILIFVIYININNVDAKHYDFRSSMQNLFNKRMTELDVKATNNNSTSDKDSNCKYNNDTNKEVFHIFNNVYTYNEAKEACEDYDARLASYDEIERAYNNGATWCSYGWSKDQLALFPTQKQIYNELKKIPGHEHDCGRAGVNGGYIKNPNVKFGANCYGVKPKAKENDKSYMHAINHSPNIRHGTSIYEDVLKERKKDYIIAPFNKDTWSIK